MYDIIIIGGDAAGMSAASRISKLKPDWKFVVIEKQNYISYGACGLPYYISGVVRDINSIFAMTPREAKEKRNIDVMLNAEAKEIDVERKILKVYSYKEKKEMEFSFKKLIIATGARPFIPPIDGIKTERTFTLRNPDDALKIKEFINSYKPRRAIIVGGGPLGLEMAEAFRILGMETTVIEMKDRLIPQVDAEISDVVEKVLRENGVEVKKGEKLTGVDSGKRGLKVYTDKGEYETEMLFLALGVRPNSEIATSAGIKAGPAGAIDVNERMMTNIDGIYAGGDCADALHIVSGEKVYIPLGTTANRQGRIAGINACGGNATFHGVLGTFVVKVFSLEVGATGLNEEVAKKKFNVDTVTVNAHSRAGYYPGGKNITIKLVFERESGRLIGAEMAGEEGVAKRIDVFATALFKRMTVEEIYNLDLSYAPPFAPVWDPILIAAENAVKKFKK